MVNYDLHMRRPDGVIEIHNGDMKTLINAANVFINTNYHLSLNINRRILTDLVTRDHLVNCIIRNILFKMERKTPVGITAKKAALRVKRTKKNGLSTTQNTIVDDSGDSVPVQNTEQHTSSNDLQE